jgi:hypothetical protein
VETATAALLQTGALLPAEAAAVRPTAELGEGKPGFDIETVALVITPSISEKARIA